MNGATDNTEKNACERWFVANHWNFNTKTTQNTNEKIEWQIYSQQNGMTFNRIDNNKNVKRKIDWVHSTNDSLAEREHQIEWLTMTVTTVCARLHKIENLSKSCTEDGDDFWME